MKLKRNDCVLRVGGERTKPSNCRGDKDLAFPKGRPVTTQNRQRDGSTSILGDRPPELGETCVGRWPWVPAWLTGGSCPPSSDGPAGPSW